MPTRSSQLVDQVTIARKNVEGLVFSFTSRYHTALTQLKGGQTIEVSREELQEDLRELRKNMAILLQRVATIESAIEDLL